MNIIVNILKGMYVTVFVWYEKYVTKEWWWFGKQRVQMSQWNGGDLINESKWDDRMVVSR